MIAHSQVGSPSLERYISKLNRKLFFMSNRKRKLLIQECRAHLSELADELGGQDEGHYRRAIERFGSPKKIADEYKQLYGYGIFYKILVIIFGIISSNSLTFSLNFSSDRTEKLPVTVTLPLK